jgi:hypothetical protein
MYAYLIDTEILHLQKKSLRATMFVDDMIHNIQNEDNYDAMDKKLGEVQIIIYYMPQVWLNFYHICNHKNIIFTY